MTLKYSVGITKPFLNDVFYACHRFINLHDISRYVYAQEDARMPENHMNKTTYLYVDILCRLHFTRELLSLVPLILMYEITSSISNGGKTSVAVIIKTVTGVAVVLPVKFNYINDDLDLNYIRYLFELKFLEQSSS